MSNKLIPTTDSCEPLAYEIRLKGQLDSAWADWFDGLTITADDDGTTRLSGPAIDQAALHGLLKKVRDLGLTLISINPLKPDQIAVAPIDPMQSTVKGTEE